NLKNKNKNPYLIKVNRYSNCVTVYTYDKDGKYTVPVRAMVCSCGKNNSTPTGNFSIKSNQYRWHPLYGNVYGQYVTGIVNDILFHSVPYKSQSQNTLKVSEYNSLGKSVSMGCVRLSVSDAKWIQKNCKTGTTVIIYDSKNAGPLGKPNAMHISSNSTWDPTDDSSNNPYLYKKPVISGVKTITVFVGTKKKDIDFMSGIKAKDTCGNSIKDKVKYSTNADLNKKGTYDITYTVKDDMNRTDTVFGKLVVK
ncbi:MAG: L,D-transpeptidase family protein, partial [Acutalibacteraceae bacterium]